MDGGRAREEEAEPPIPEAIEEVAGPKQQQVLEPESVGQLLEEKIRGIDDQEENYKG